jgi:hypothetical protein
MTDLVAAAVQAAQMADPNGINTELTRVLLTVVLAEGFEMQDAADIVARIFPKGYNAMAELAKAQQAGMPQQPGAPGQGGTNFFGPGATDQPPNPENAYGAPQTATPPEKVPGAQEGVFYYIEGGKLIEARAPEQEWEVPPLLIVGRHGHPVLLPGTPRGGSREATVPLHNGRIVTVSRDFDRDVRGATMDALASMDMHRMSESDNGNH